MFSQREFIDLIEARLVISNSRSLSLDSRAFVVSGVAEETNGVYVILTRGFDIVGIILWAGRKLLRFGKKVIRLGLRVWGFGGLGMGVGVVSDVF